MGWSWLERWMATRFPEATTFESRASKPVEPIYKDQRFKTGKTVFEIAGEEKESCGSNEVSVSFDGISVKPANQREGSKTTRNRKTITIRSVSKRKTVPTSHCPKDYPKVGFALAAYFDLNRISNSFTDQRNALPFSVSIPGF